MKITVEGSHELTHPAEYGTLDAEVRVDMPGDEVAAAMDRALALAREVESQLAEAGGAGGKILAHTLGAPTTTWWREPGEDGGAGDARVQVRIPLSASAESPVVLGQLAARWGATRHLCVIGARWDVREGTRRRLQDDALRAAFAEATRRADLLAQASGGGTVEILEIEDRTPPGLSGPFLARSLSAGGGAPGGDAPIEIDPEPVTVRAEVRLVARLATDAAIGVSPSGAAPPAPPAAR